MLTRVAVLQLCCSPSTELIRIALVYEAFSC